MHSAPKKGHMRKKTLRASTGRPDRTRAKKSLVRPRTSKPSSDGADFETREFPNPEPPKKKLTGDRTRGKSSPEVNSFSEQAARLQVHIFVKRYRKRAQGFLWDRASALSLADFIKIADFERETSKQTSSKRPREVRVIWTKNDSAPE